MKDERLVWSVVRMLYERARYWEDSSLERSLAYQSAHDMLLYALDGNAECLKEFDTYSMRRAGS